MVETTAQQPLFGMQVERKGGLSQIAIEVDRRVSRRVAFGEPGRAAGTTLARGDGWSVDDVICTLGPDDRPFEEQHSGVAIAVVVAGSFQYRSDLGRTMLAPGSLLLGNPGQRFECGHEHAVGDRCVAFRFTVEYFDQIAADVGGRGASCAFAVGRLPPLQRTSRLTAGAAAGILGAVTAWEELGLELAVQALRLANQLPDRATTPRAAEARVTQSVRSIERNPAAHLTLQSLATEAGLSPFHYLRTFERVTGVTPHQFILRIRLREAAIRLATESGRIAEIGFGTGFGDLSNFNRAFRAEFGMTPNRFRALGSVP